MKDIKRLLHLDDLLLDDNSPVEPEVALWRGVITQALMDAGSKSPKDEMISDKTQALTWLRGNSKDFLTVCALADLDPDYVKAKARRAIKNHCTWRKYNSNSFKKRKK